MPVTLDMFEYSTDELARAAWVIADAYGPDVTSQAYASASSHYLNFYATGAFDDTWELDPDDRWLTNIIASWLKQDFGAGNEKVIAKYVVYGRDHEEDPKNWTFEGSNNNVDWDILDTQVNQSLPGMGSGNTYPIVNTTAYRYYRINITANWGSTYLSIIEMEMMEMVLQCYSEDIIVEQGLYSLKIEAGATGSLNATLTRTLDPTLDLSDLTKIKLGIYALRTGTNIKARIRDLGGTWSEYSIAISIANTWETKEWDISGIPNPNKDAINRIEFKIIEASEDNTFYLDNMFANWWSKIFTEQIVLSDTFSRRWSIYRTFTETLHLTDTVSKKISKIFSEAITLTDTIKKKVGKVFTENISLTDTFSRVWTIYRTFTENISLTDTISKKISKIFTETLHLQDTFSRVWTIYRTFTEKITLTDKVKAAKTNLVNLIKKLIRLEDIED